MESGADLPPSNQGKWILLPPRKTLLPDPLELELELELLQNRTPSIPSFTKMPICCFEPYASFLCAVTAGVGTVVVASVVAPAALASIAMGQVGGLEIVAAAAAAAASAVASAVAAAVAVAAAAAAVAVAVAP